MYINIYSCPGSATGASLPAAHCPRCLPWPCRASLSEKGRPSGPRAQSPPPHPWQASPRGPVPLWQARLARFQTPQAAWPVWPAWIEQGSGIPGSRIRELRSSDPRSGSGNRGLGSGIWDPGSRIRTSYLCVGRRHEAEPSKFLKVVEVSTLN